MAGLVPAIHESSALHAMRRWPGQARRFIKTAQFQSDMPRTTNCLVNRNWLSVSSLVAIPHCNILELRKISGNMYEWTVWHDGLGKRQVVRGSASGISDQERGPDREGTDRSGADVR